MFQHILVPLDGSMRAELALPVVACIARATGGSVLLVQVINLPIDYSGGLATASLMDEQTIASVQTEATEYLHGVAERMLAGIKTTTEVVFGVAAQQIMGTARAHHCDLVALCSHGRTGFARWALGSVARTLINESVVPTLVVRGSEPAMLLADPSTTRPLCALVPLDGSELAQAALVPAAYLVAALAAPAQGELHLAQVVKPFQAEAAEGFVSELNEEAKERARSYLARESEHVQTLTKNPRLSIGWSVIDGEDAASALVSLAEQGHEGTEAAGMSNYDLIAISTHGRHGLERWMMGSVTDRLLTNTKLPMLIVRPPQHT